MQIDRLEIFGSLVRIARLDGMQDLNGEVGAGFVEEAASTPGVNRSNVGGWHSPPDLALRRAGPIATLMGRLAAEVDRTVKELAHVRGLMDHFNHGYRMHGWAMVLGQGAYVTPHDHGEAHLSVAYYVDAGDPPPPDSPAGQLVFCHPRAALIPGLDLFPSQFVVQPETGMMVIFPSQLTHFVHPYQGARPRICISLNVRIEPRRPR